MSFYHSVRVLGLVISADLGPDKHVSQRNMLFAISVDCDIRRSLSTESATTLTLMHAFVTSRIDYCNVVFVEAPKVCYQQTTTSVECGSPSGQWYEEVRTWSDAATALRSSLA